MSGGENYSNLFYTHPATYLTHILLWQPISKSYSRCPSHLSLQKLAPAEQTVCKCWLTQARKCYIIRLTKQPKQLMSLCCVCVNPRAGCVSTNTLQGLAAKMHSYDLCVYSVQHTSYQPSDQQFNVNDVILIRKYMKILL